MNNSLKKIQPIWWLTIDLCNKTVQFDMNKHFLKKCKTLNCIQQGSRTKHMENWKASLNNVKNPIENPMTIECRRVDKSNYQRI